MSRRDQFTILDRDEMRVMRELAWMVVRSKQNVGQYMRDMADSAKRIIEKKEQEQTEPAPPNVLTCVYCGQAYPEGTPPHGSDVLTAHIKGCEKHPMRKAEEKIKQLRDAMAALLGVSTKESLLVFQDGLASLQNGAWGSPALAPDYAALNKAVSLLLEDTAENTQHE